MGYPLHRGYWQPKCFNGAEAKKPRKWRDPNDMPIVMTRFNGAEAKKPRKSFTSVRKSVIIVLLQWGRGKKASEIKIGMVTDGEIYSFNGAEAKKPRKLLIIMVRRLYHHGLLQWGRGKKASEIITPVCISILLVMLQWGRGKKASEIG